MLHSSSNNPIEDLEGPRACGVYELPGVLDLANLVMRTLNVPKGQPPRRPSIGTDYSHVFNADNLDNIRVFTQQGRAVCSVGIYPTLVRTPVGTLSVGGISCLVTHPDYRGRGLATRIMEDAHRQMRASECQVALLSTRIVDYYRKLGWESAGRQRTFTFDRGNIAALPESKGLEITQEWRPLVEELNVLHLTEPIAALRDADRFGLLMNCKSSRIFVALQRQEPVAYAAFRGTTVTEYAGALEHVAPLLRAAFTELDDPDAPTSGRMPGQRSTIDMHIQTPNTAEGLPAYLMQKGIPHSYSYLGMLKILDPAGLFDALQISEIEVVSSGDRWRLLKGGETGEFGECELVRLVFGPERLTDFAEDIFPVSFYQWPPDRV